MKLCRTAAFLAVLIAYNGCFLRASGQQDDERGNATSIAGEARGREDLRSPGPPDPEGGESRSEEDEAGKKQLPLQNSSLPEMPQIPADDVVVDDAMTFDPSVAGAEPQTGREGAPIDPSSDESNVESAERAAQEQRAGAAEADATRSDEDPMATIPPVVELAESLPGSGGRSDDEAVVDAPTNESSSAAESSTFNTTSSPEESDLSQHGSLPDSSEVAATTQEGSDPDIQVEETSSEKGVGPNATQGVAAVVGDSIVNATLEETAPASFGEPPSRTAEDSAQGAASAGGRAGAAASSPAEEPVETYPLPVCGIWGTPSSRSGPAPDLKALYLLFEGAELGEPPRKAIPSADDLASQITDSAFEQARRAGRRRPAPAGSGSGPPSDDASSEPDRREPARNETRPSKSSANSEFVDGLDDIGKLFEDVEPPDELDVGAVGTSIQEVLMGQGTQIILKRLRMGLNLVRRTFLAAKDRLSQRLVDEDGNLTIVDPETLESAARWIWASSKRLYHRVQTLLDQLVERGIAGGLSREYEEDEASASSPEDIADMRELLRQYSRVGGAGNNPPKKVQ